MRHHKKWKWGVVCLVALAIFPTAIPRGGRAQVVNYTVTDLGVLGGAQSTAFGMNNCGQVVGQSTQTSSPFEHAFSWKNGQMTDINPPNSNPGWATAVNANGIASGLAGSPSHPYLLSETAAPTDLGTLGGHAAAAHDINDSNQVVGESETAGAPGVISGRAFIWDAINGMIAIPTLSGTGWNGANGVNNAGEVVGHSQTTSGTTHAFLFSGGELTDLGTLGTGSRSFAADINDNSEVVGYSTITTGGVSPPFHGFIWSLSTGMYDMGTLGGTNSRAYDINATGQAIGTKPGSLGAGKL